MKRTFSILMILIAAIMGCTQRNIVKPANLSEEKAPVIEQKQTGEEQTGKYALKGRSGEVSEKALSKEQVSTLRTAIKDLETKYHDIYFDFDKYDISDDAKPLLQRMSAVLLRNGQVRVMIEGHCDERGTAEYNLALGDRRASAVMQYLLSLGIPSNRMETISYGKEKPVCTESNERCWSRNRRAHFVFK